MHEVAARPEPGLVAALQAEIGDMLRRHQPAVGDAAGKGGRFLAEEQRTHGGMNAVGADHDVGLDTIAVGEAGPNRITAVIESDEAMAEMDALLGQARRDDPLQIRTVHGQMWSAVKLAGDRVERGFLQRAAVVPAPHMRRQRPHRVAVERIPKSEPVEDACRVRPHIDAAADLVELGGLLVDIDREAGAMQRQRRGKAADAAADHRNSARFAGHHGRVKRRGGLVSTATEGE